MAVLQQVNERYIPQLQQVLTWPQSIGIVGGRPSSSLYFVGCQDDQVMYLDPHQAQQVQSAACSLKSACSSEQFLSLIEHSNVG